MTQEVVILIAEDDPGHALLLRKNLERAGIKNPIIHFKDGQETIDFLFRKGNGLKRDENTPYLLLLDIRMPKVDGVEVLRQIKAHEALHKLPVTMLTTTDDPREIDKCYELGCSNYIVKPVDYEKFFEVLRQLGLFLMVVEVPVVSGGGQ